MIDVEPGTSTSGRTSGVDNAVLAAIRNRRSIGKMLTEVPDRSLIEQVIEAGTWAPNHHLTEPWRFFVLEGDARVRLGEAMGAIAAARETDSGRASAVAASTATKPLRAPILVAIGVEPAETAPQIEEIAAVSAAAQNMLLAAEAVGLAAIWRSGWIAFTPEMRDFFGLSTNGSLLGFIYLGYPAMERPTRERSPIASVTKWWS